VRQDIDRPYIGRPGQAGRPVGITVGVANSSERLLLLSRLEPLGLAFAVLGVVGFILVPWAINIDIYAWPSLVTR
jgi:hypothetical protein